MSFNKFCRIYIIRHAETDKNIFKKNNITQINSLDSSLIFDKNCKLNHTGKIKAGIVGDYFASMENNISIVYSSPLIRAVETADIILKRVGGDVDFSVDERLFCGKIDKLTGETNLLSDVQEFIENIVSIYMGYSVILVTHNHIFNIIRKLYMNDLIPTQEQDCLSQLVSPQQKYKVENCSMSCLQFADTVKIPQINFWAKHIKVSYSLE